MNEVEQTLSRTLGQAAEHAPRMPGLLPSRLEGIHLRRRRRGRMALAAAAVVLVAGGGVAVVRGGDTITVVPATAQVAETPAARVTEVWPQAVRKLPAKAPGGAPWHVTALIDDRTLLMETSTKAGTAGILYAYDLDAGTQREIATVSQSADTYGFANGFAVGNGRVAWWSSKDSVAHLWTVPLTGGTPKRVADHRLAPSDDGSAIDQLEVVDDKIVFSVYTGGVFEVPMADGTVEPVSGGTGMHVLEWPWIGAPGMGGERKGLLFENIRNVETGETRTAVVHPGEKFRICGVTICLGQTSEGETLFRHRDGSSQKSVPGDTPGLRPPTQDRFYVSTYGDIASMGVGLYDLETGKSGDLGLRGEGREQGVSFFSLPSTEPTGRILSYPLGDDLYVIDLAKMR
ncbi:hypothetical protein ACFOY2_41455 [Nonomuraea purpurea]|uniref:WD40 repeat domain-containing protein n=1 Tax=Nonomuraea purpurea TaxID=1849276 RepID=A0ABV8GNB7_9ACTN